MPRLPLLATVALLAGALAATRPEVLQTLVSKLPVGFSGPSIAAEIVVTADGRFAFVSNHGHDSLAIFAGSADGARARLGHVACGGRHPRHFALSPDQRWLLCAHRDADSITKFARDAPTGRFAPVDQPATRVPQPPRILFL